LIAKSNNRKRRKNQKKNLQKRRMPTKSQIIKKTNRKKKRKKAETPTTKTFYLVALSTRALCRLLRQRIHLATTKLNLRSKNEDARDARDASKWSSQMMEVTAVFKF